jgi:hypothetical protein
MDDADSRVPQGTEWCPECNGDGSSLMEEAERCSRGGGSGQPDQRGLRPAAPSSGRVWRERADGPCATACRNVYPKELGRCGSLCSLRLEPALRQSRGDRGPKRSGPAVRFERGQSRDRGSARTGRPVLPGPPEIGRVVQEQVPVFAATPIVGESGDAALDVAQQWLDAEVDATRAGDRGSA